MQTVFLLTPLLFSFAFHPLHQSLPLFPSPLFNFDPYLCTSLLFSFLLSFILILLLHPCLFFLLLFLTLFLILFLPPLLPPYFAHPLPACLPSSFLSFSFSLFCSTTCYYEFMFLYICLHLFFPSPPLTRFFSMSSSLGEVTKMVLLMRPVKHQNTSASLRTSARMGARMSDMP